MNDKGESPKRGSSRLLTGLRKTPMKVDCFGPVGE
jgi:hypothetical protein